MKVLGRMLFGFLAAAGAVLAVGAPASGHANFERADPPSGATLQEAPRRLQLWFSEPLESGFSDVQVLEQSGRRVDLGDSRIAPDDRTSMEVSLRLIPRGTYSVAWRALSAVDGHVTRGVYSLLIGVAAQETLPAPPAQVYPITRYEIPVRWLGYLGGAAVIGAAAFVLVVLRPAAGMRDPFELRQVGHRIAVRMTWVSLAVLACSAVASLWVQVHSVLEPGASPSAAQTAVKLMTQTRYGTAWVARMVIIGVLAVSTLWLSRRPQAWWTVGAIGSALLLTTALNSHGAALTGWLPPFADWVHLVAGAAWVGGLFAFALLLAWVVRNVPKESRAEFLAGLVPRFSVLAVVCVLLLVATGFYLTWAHVGAWTAFRETLYGQSLAVKLLLVIPLLALGTINLTVIRRRLIARRSQMPGAAWAGWLRRTVSAEAAVAIMVMLVAAALTSLPPARQIYPQLAGSRPFVYEVRTGAVNAALTVAPARPGLNTFEIMLRDTGGRAVENAERVDLRFTFLDRQLGTSIDTLTARGGGRYAASSGALSIEGLWQIEVLVRLPQRDDLVSGFRVQVSSTGMRIQAPAARIRLPGLSWLFRRPVRNPIAPTPEALETGSQIYHHHCAVCHGVDGAGNGPAASQLNRRPADLRVHMAAGHTDDQLFRWVSDGMSGTAMPAFRAKLSIEERWTVITFIRSMFTPTDR